MPITPEPTPNLHLQPIEANRNTWAEIMNTNLRLIDASVGAYFAIQNLQGAWQNSTTYTVGQSVIDTTTAAVYQCQVAHISASIPTTFEEDRAEHTDYWNVYSSTARARGVWLPSTGYALNDFVVNGPQYAVCVETHVSSESFENDVAEGLWSVLIDVSAVGEDALPALGGAGDANKTVATNSTGTGYTILSQTDELAILGATATGKAVLQAASQAAARTAINAQIAGSYVTGGPYQPLGSYQPLSSNLSTLAGVTSGAFGRTALAYATVSQMESALGGLGTAAPLNVGTAANNVVQLNGSAQLPAVSGLLLTNMVAQQKEGYNTLPSTASGIIPYDNTIPESSEGDLIISQGITPRNATSILNIHASIIVTGSATQQFTIALFVDSETDARAVSTHVITNVGTYTCSLHYPMVAGTTSPITISIRAGTSSGGYYLHSNGGGSLFGEISGTTLIIQEAAQG